MSLCYTIDQKSVQILIKLFCQNLLLTFILKPLKDQREWIFMEFNLVYNLVASNKAVQPD